MPPQARYEQHDDVGELVLDAPPLNLFGPAMFDDLSAAIGQAKQATPRALVLRSDADAFSAGADVRVFSELDAESAQPFTERLLAFAHAVEDLPCPTLAIVGGVCLTAGLELSLACDLLWAGEGVQFGLVEAVVGITPLMGGTQRMAERAGTARAREFVMTGGLYTAETLHSWGVVNRVVAGDELLEKGMRFAARLASGPTLAHVATKRIVRAAADHGTRGADAVTAELTSGLFETSDARSAVSSFLEHGPGKATFTGRGVACHWHISPADAWRDSAGEAAARSGVTSRARGGRSPHRCYCLEAQARLPILRLIAAAADHPRGQRVGHRRDAPRGAMFSERSGAPKLASRG